MIAGKHIYMFACYFVMLLFCRQASNYRIHVIRFAGETDSL